MSVRNTQCEKLRSDCAYMSALALTLCVLVFTYSSVAAIDVHPSDSTQPLLGEGISSTGPLMNFGGMAENVQNAPLVAAGEVFDCALTNLLKLEQKR